MPLFKAFVKEQINGERLQPNGKVIRKATIKNYKTLLKTWSDYELKPKPNCELGITITLTHEPAKLKHGIGKSFI
ncbi:MAG: hypothetical protein IPG89_13090 [Bacteroidetes bacterium]|nr:hypothetical protein [Bacteroidota bacterium]